MAGCRPVYPLVSHRAQCRALLESSARHPEPFGDVSSGKAGCDGHRSQRQRLQSTCRRTPGMRVDDAPSLVQQPSCPSLLLVALTCARTAPDRHSVYRFADCDARDLGRRQRARTTWEVDPRIRIEGPKRKKKLPEANVAAAPPAAPKMKPAAPAQATAVTPRTLRVGLSHERHNLRIGTPDDDLALYARK